jgi:kynureninase
MSFSQFNSTLFFAERMDETDPLKEFRTRFLLPKNNGKEKIYLCGNSLGLQPKTVKDYLTKELENWGNLGVEGHFMGKNPWVYARKTSKPALAMLLGAKESEVSPMNSLSSNLHLLLVSFYRPRPGKHKILTEAGAFPSDQYILASQARFHGYDPKDAILEIHPRPGEHILKTEDILKKIENHAHELALVMMAGVQYYTGQWFDMEKISACAKSHGIPIGFDLAHAIGNVPMRLHDWGVDFATWCSYKYLNGGPGNVSGIFVHDDHGQDFKGPRFTGWWGTDEKTRFEMENEFQAMPGADGWLLSNDNVLGLAALQASLDLFLAAGITRIRKKSELLTGYLEFLVKNSSEDPSLIEIITPSNPTERGTQLSLFIHKGGKEVFEHMCSQGVVADWRNPNVIRVAPCPLYNNFVDLYYFGKIIKHSIQKFVD